jgi:hypothetical protein
MGLTSFIKNKFEEQKQRKQIREESKPAFMQGYREEQGKLQAKKGREQARRDNQGFGSKIGAFADAFGQDTNQVEHAFGFDALGFGPKPKKKVSHQKTVVIKVVGAEGQHTPYKKQKRQRRPYSLDPDEW